MAHNNHPPTDGSPGIVVTERPVKLPTDRAFLVEYWAVRVQGPAVHTAVCCDTQAEVDELVRKIHRAHVLVPRGL